MSSRRKVLWLVSWYPNKYDPFDGDFIQRHARAATLYDDIHVLFVKSSEAQKTIQIERRESEGLVEQIIYLPTKKGKPGKFISLLKWQSKFRTAARQIIQFQKPDLVHVHIPWKAGLIALWIKREFKIPYVLTEHWGIYNTIVDDNIHTKPVVVRYFLKRIYRNATAFISVSQYLGDGLNQTLIKKCFRVVPNVVDTNLFQTSSLKNERFTFLHVSNMVPLKNVEGILKAFASFLNSTKSNAQLIMIGNRDNDYIAVAEELGLTDEYVSFKGEVTYPNVAAAMKSAHVFVLNSHIENSPCVIGEALCCGLPIIATAVGGIPELVNENNGLLILPNDHTMLTEAMKKLWTNYACFNREEIAADAKQKFAPAVIGQQLHELYATDNN